MINVLYKTFSINNSVEPVILSNECLDVIYDTNE